MAPGEMKRPVEQADPQGIGRVEGSQMFRGTLSSAIRRARWAATG